MLQRAVKGGRVRGALVARALAIYALASTLLLALRSSGVVPTRACAVCSPSATRLRLVRSGALRALVAVVVCAFLDLRAPRVSSSKVLRSK